MLSGVQFKGRRTSSQGTESGWVYGEGSPWAHHHIRLAFLLAREVAVTENNNDGSGLVAKHFYTNLLDIKEMWAECYLHVCSSTRENQGTERLITNSWLPNRKSEFKRISFKFRFSASPTLSMLALSWPSVEGSLLILKCLFTNISQYVVSGLPVCFGPHSRPA